MLSIPGAGDQSLHSSVANNVEELLQVSFGDVDSNRSKTVTVKNSSNNLNEKNSD